MGVGIITAIIIGGLAGLAAEKAMNFDVKWYINIALGVAGAFILSIPLTLFGFEPGGIIAYFVTAFAGAVGLIYAYGKWQQSKDNG